MKGDAFNVFRTQKHLPPSSNNTKVRTLTTTLSPFVPPTAMDATSPFSKLSGELRNRIYHFFFASQLASQTHIDIRSSSARLKRNQNRTRSALALTKTSHQLRRETLAIFWSTASFRIVADTLTAFANANDAYPDISPLHRADHINETRAAILRRWLKRSGVLRFARTLRPIELDLGVWDPQMYAREHQAHVLHLLGENTAALTTPLRYIVSSSLKVPAECTIVFRVQVQPSTGLGPIYVPNDRKQALASIAELCGNRQASVQARYQEGMLTRHGYSVLFHDVASCHAVADLLVGYIVEEKEEEESDDSGESAGVKSVVGQKGKRSGK